MAQTQHYHLTVTATLHGLMLPLIQIGKNLGAGDSLFSQLFPFFGFLSSTNLCFASLYFVISVQKKKLLCVCCSLPVEERRNLPALPELSGRVIPFCVSVTPQLLLPCDAQRPNCPTRPNIPRTQCPCCPYSEPKHLSHLSLSDGSDGMRHTALGVRATLMESFTCDANV